MVDSSLGRSSRGKGGITAVGEDDGLGEVHAPAATAGRLHGGRKAYFGKLLARA